MAAHDLPGLPALATVTRPGHAHLDDVDTPYPLVRHDMRRRGLGDRQLARIDGVADDLAALGMWLAEVYRRYQLPYRCPACLAVGRDLGVDA